MAAPPPPAPSRTWTPGSRPGPPPGKPSAHSSSSRNRPARTCASASVITPLKPARTPPEQRLAWLKELHTGTSESLPYRVAGTLLLLYAQPLVRVAALRTDAIRINATTGTISISFGKHPAPVPQPLAELLSQHIRTRPNLRTCSKSDNLWLFPGTRAGHHLHPNTIMDRLRSLGLELLGARNTALDEHLSVTPPPLVADALGYSYQVAFLHADNTGEGWSRYAALTPYRE